MKPGPVGKPKKLLELWEFNFNYSQKELRFSEIVQRAKIKLNIEKRTVNNYLKILVREKILKKRVDNDRHTFYKPINTMEHAKSFLKKAIDETDDYELVENLCRRILQNLSVGN